MEDDIIEDFKNLLYYISIVYRKKFIIKNTTYYHLYNVFPELNYKENEVYINENSEFDSCTDILDADNMKIFEKLYGIITPDVILKNSIYLDIFMTKSNENKLEYQINSDNKNNTLITYKLFISKKYLTNINLKYNVIELKNKVKIVELKGILLKFYYDILEIELIEKIEKKSIFNLDFSLSKLYNKNNSHEIKLNKFFTKSFNGFIEDNKEIIRNKFILDELRLISYIQKSINKYFQLNDLEFDVYKEYISHGYKCLNLENYLIHTQYNVVDCIINIYKSIKKEYLVNNYDKKLLKTLEVNNDKFVNIRSFILNIIFGNKNIQSSYINLKKVINTVNEHFVYSKDIITMHFIAKYIKTIQINEIPEKYHKVYNFICYYFVKLLYAGGYYYLGYRFIDQHLKSENKSLIYFYNLLFHVIQYNRDNPNDYYDVIELFNEYSKFYNIEDLCKYEFTLEVDAVIIEDNVLVLPRWVNLYEHKFELELETNYYKISDYNKINILKNIEYKPQIHVKINKGIFIF